MFSVTEIVPSFTPALINLSKFCIVSCFVDAKIQRIFHLKVKVCLYLCFFIQKSALLHKFCEWDFRGSIFNQSFEHLTQSFCKVNPAVSHSFLFLCWNIIHEVAFRGTTADDAKPLPTVLLSHLPHHVFDKLKCLHIRLCIKWCAFWNKEQAEELIFQTARRGCRTQDYQGVLSNNNAKFLHSNLAMVVVGRCWSLFKDGAITWQLNRVITC